VSDVRFSALVPCPRRDVPSIRNLLPLEIVSEELALSNGASRYTPDQGERLRKIHARLIEARRELDALIGDAYLRPRASIVPVHFLDLASAVEKLRWAEKEWRELDKEVAEGEHSSGADAGSAEDDSDALAEDDSEHLLEAVPAEPA
jgi:hypothetical protein